jgi:hypothetical protein
MIKGLFRVSSTPGKTLLWLMLKNDLKNITGELGVDLAGGSMLNRPFFKTKKYVSVDINQIKLSEGLESYPDAVVENDTIQNYLSLTNEQPDLLVCVQTFGTNMFFEHDETIHVIDNMYKTLKIGGSMAFNIGVFGDVNLDELKKNLSLSLKSKFKNINFSFYGAFHQRFKLPRWKLTKNGIQRISNDKINKAGFLKKIINFAKVVYMFGLAYIMFLLPPLRTLLGKKKLFLYCFCNNKL